MASSETDLDVHVDADGTIHLGRRTIPQPCSISAEARQLLATPRTAPRTYPPLDDKQAWRDLIAETDASFAPGVERALQLTEGRATIETTTIGGATVHIGTPTSIPARNRDRAWITVHGGALVALGGPWARAEAGIVAVQRECVAYSVDYRMPPDHPYPAGVDDVVAVYRELLDRYEPRDVVISGTSAGGNIAPAAVLKARDQGLPLPGALMLFTPECDLTETGDTFHTLRDLDPRLPRPLPESIALYADGHDLEHPYLSPIFADFSAGFPPTYIQSGTRDLFLSNCVRMHRALRNAGIEAELHVWEAALHGGFFMSDAPEAAEEQAEHARFLTKHWGVRPESV
jgi:monoterpene epsilon-lactone hydrolase